MDAILKRMNKDGCFDVPDHRPEGGNLAKSWGKRLPGEDQGWLWACVFGKSRDQYSWSRVGEWLETGHDEIKSFKPASDST